MNGSPTTSWLWRGVHVAVLWAFAVVQPLLDLLGDNAAFFIARGNEAADVLIFAVAWTVLPPLAILGLERLIDLLSSRWAWFVHLAFIAVLAGTFALVALDGVLDARGWVLLALALAVGLASGLAYERSDAARSLLSFLGPAPIVFLVLFLFISDASKVVLPQDDAEALAAGSGEKPLVVVVFDELPTSSLMDDRGRIAGRRFPNFAALARRSTWYPNATTVADHTDDAVPAILAGVRPDPDLEALSSEYPDNLFTLLAGAQRLNVHERTARLCPETFCEVEVGSFADRLRQLISDLGVVEAHLLLPDSLTGSLPPVNEGFAGFGAPTAEDEDRPHIGFDQHAIDALLSGIASQPRSLHFIHMTLPHTPWRYLPDGTDYAFGDVWREYNEGETEIWPADGRWVTQQALRAHLFQTGYADVVLGRILRAVRSAGIWEEAAIVVLTDHGASFTPGTPRRNAEGGNVGEIAPIPVFVKEPGQAAGRVDQRAIRTIDVLPTIAELLGLQLPFRTDGRPADQVRERSTIAVLRNDEVEPRRLGFNRAVRGRDRAALRIQRLFGGGWRGVWRMGPLPELIGRRISAFDVAPRQAGATFALNRPADYSEVDPDADYVPALISGRLEGVARGAALAVSVNGRIAVTTRAYRSVDGGVLIAALVPPRSFREGANDVGVYATVDGRRGPALQALGGTD